MMSSSKEPKGHNYPPNSQQQGSNERMLNDIRVKLAAHQKEGDRKSVTPSPVTVRETATPSPIAADITSPGASRGKQKSMAVKHKMKMDQIRNSLKPHHRSDPGFQYPTEHVNQDMLRQLISRGFDENSSVQALAMCNNSSIEEALNILSPSPIKSAQDKASVAMGDSQSRPSPVPDYMKSSIQQKFVDEMFPDDYDVDTTSSKNLPGNSMTPTSTKSSYSSRIGNYPESYRTLITRDLSPINSSPEGSPRSTPPPNPEMRQHVHVSPPPDVQPRTYSPFSAPFTYQRQTPPVYDKFARLPHGYSPMLRPSSELSDSGIEEEAPIRRNIVPPEAFKFYMEQHIENVLKSYQQRQQRRMKLEMEMGKRGLDEATCEQMRKLLAQKESNFLRMKRAKMHMSQFDIVRPIGVGAFGVVSLVRKKDTHRLYAMKSLRKADVVRRNQVAHVKAERDILAEADNEWVVKLYYSFQDSECLYFVMEYIPGGDMMSLLIKLGTFPEHLALFYISELVCAIESVHKMGFIHRDIKPDNILIEADGHIKLTDFGLCTGFRWTHDSKRYLPKGSNHHRQGSIEPDQSAWKDPCTCGGDTTPLKPLEVRRLKEHHRCVAHSLVGTPNYIAPEILRRVGYTQLCDWWSVGVIMYEMIVGQPPFMAPTPADTQIKIVNWPDYLRVPMHTQMSPAARDLVLRFLSDPQERIGKNGADEIKKHPFFTSRIDWEVGIRNYVAPYKPKIMYEEDTSNFDPIPPSQLQKLYGKQQQMQTLPEDHPKHAFYEFTFIRFAASDKPSDQRPSIAPNPVNSNPAHHHRDDHDRHTHDKVTREQHSREKREKKRSTQQPVYV